MFLICLIVNQKDNCQQLGSSLLNVMIRVDQELESYDLKSVDLLRFEQRPYRLVLLLRLKELSNCCEEKSFVHIVNL